ncbi:hypothetical protein [Neolewinella antarctica]|uniref:Uncharacterized protein n=1 Tax=Neolewinella antarctica TaxID=442734 RepID=A0ABX0X6P5_9BACT|nr:hypothetical protein [Neolewinella antarctica]NJC24802.1 hypothetical protein [Neolewinella antarctica]
MLSLSLTDFYALTPWEFIEAYEARRTYDQDRWQQTRYIMWAAMRPHYKKLDVTDVLSLSVDKAAAKPPPETEEQRQQRLKVAAKLDAQAALEYANRNQPQP